MTAEGVRGRCAPPPYTFSTVLLLTVGDCCATIVRLSEKHVTAPLPRSVACSIARERLLRN